MTASQPSLLELAKQGDATAIAALMNRHLQPKGVTASATLEDGCLQVALESQQVPNQPSLTEFIQKGITNLGVDAIKRVRVYGVQTGKTTPVWEQDIPLQPFGAVAESQPLEAPLPTAEEVVPAMSDADPDLQIDPDPEAPKKSGMGSFLGRNWTVVPMMLVAALIGFAVVVFVVNRTGRSPQPVAESPATSPTEAPTDPAASPIASPTSPTVVEAPVTSPPATPNGSPIPAPDTSPAASVSPSPATPESSATAPSPGSSPSAIASPSEGTDANPEQLLDRALELGLSAAVKTQTAATQAEWGTVVSEWQQAIALLGDVPSSDVTYATAQQKITEYQRNLTYAQQRQQQATNP